MHFRQMSDILQFIQSGVVHGTQFLSLRYEPYTHLKQTPVVISMLRLSQTHVPMAVRVWLAGQLVRGAVHRVLEGSRISSCLQVRHLNGSLQVRQELGHGWHAPEDW